MRKDKIFKPIRKVLIANRGEIAIRIARAAEELGIQTIGVYTHEDRHSLHRFKVYESYRIGKMDDPLKPYLDIETVIATAKDAGADAIHPGYGFLSENVNFAQRCREEGLIFIGPEPETLMAVGDKVRAKEVAKKAGVPIIESSEIKLKTVEDALKEADRIGYPVLVKAAAGGGGRGMRKCFKKEDLPDLFKSAKNEAGNAFGDDTVFLEKLIEKPKHIEVQVLGDHDGNLVHLFERDCSVQRRFQKVIEVAPSPGTPQDVLDRIYDYALRIAKEVSYVNAGTVEFLVDKYNNIYFIEVNPRVQVEHTITEEITRIDIVRTQFLIAQGHSLTHEKIRINSQASITKSGYAIQCRITTEDPQNSFRPDFGIISHYRSASGYAIRLDEGSSYPGMRISPYFDSLLVKVSASGRNMRGACSRLKRALKEFRIRGVKTNIGFLQNVISHETFQKGEATVDFIENHPELMDIIESLDRGSKVLEFLADRITNGNPDIKPEKINPSKVFRQDLLPEIEKSIKPKDGTKQKLEKLKPVKFAQWLKKEKQIYFTDTTLRDAHQSIFATRLRTADMIDQASYFAHHFPQTFSMEVWGGATFDASMNFLKECPWNRLKLVRKAVPNILLQMLLRGSNAVGYKAYPDNLVEKFIEHSTECGIDVFRIFDSLNWLENMKVSIDAVVKANTSLAEVAICYTNDILNKNEKKYSLQYYLDMAKRIEDTGAHIIAVKDMAGLLKPIAAEILIGKLKETVDIPIHLHTHDTSSNQTATYLKAVDAGVDVVDVAIGAMSGGTSQPNFNSTIAMLEDHERSNPYDLKSLNRLSEHWETIRELYYPYESGVNFGLAEVYDHQMPGGQYSNLKSQSESLGLGNRFREVKKNYILANKLLGDIVKVTPSSKVVGDFAIFITVNDLTEEDIRKRGDNLSFPESLKSLLRGEIGQPEGGFPAWLKKIVLKNEKGFTKRPNDFLDPVDFDKEFELFQEKFPARPSFSDFLSFMMYPKVFEDFYNHYVKYNEVWYLPTFAYLYGLKEGDEIQFDIDKGVNMVVKCIAIVNKPDEEGNKTISFDLNGQYRRIKSRDNSVKAEKPMNKKISEPNHVGSPLLGRLSKIEVKEGDIVDKNKSLFIIEAMKMETIVAANFKGKVEKIYLKEGATVDKDDLVIDLSPVV